MNHHICWSGFSLLEVLLCLVLVSGLGLGMSRLCQVWLPQAKQVIQVASMQQDLLLVQKYARLHHVIVTLCASSSGQQCDKHWSNGRLAWFIHDQQRQVIFFHHLHLAGARWRWRGALSNHNRLIFRSTGDNLGQQGSFFYCPHGATTLHARVVINQFGRIYVTEGQQHDC